LCRRNPLPAGLLAGIVLVFLAGNALVFWQWRVAEVARANEKSQRNAAARQAAGLPLDRGIEDARGGEPARALHLFVQALRTLPADDPESAPLERVIRMNLTAWAETVPALEQVWPGGNHRPGAAFSPDGERIVLAIGKDGIQCFRTRTGEPAGPPIRLPGGVGDAMVFAPDGRTVWVASPGSARVVEKWFIHRLDPTTGRPVQPPITTDGPLINRDVAPLVATPDGRHLVGAVAGLHPKERGPRFDAEGTREWRTASIVVWETATGLVVRQEEVKGEYREEGLTFLGLTPDGKTVTVWVPRSSSTYEGMTFSVEGKEPPVRLGRHSFGTRPDADGPDDRGTLHFHNHQRAALAIVGGQIHRWSVARPGVLEPGVPAPFRSMQYEPAPDGRSVISGREGRLFDVGAWPPRPSGVRFAHPGLLSDGILARGQYAADGRFVATSQPTGANDLRLWRLPRPHSRPPLPPADVTRLPERNDYYFFAQFDRRGTRASLAGRSHVHLRGHGPYNVRLVDLATGAVRDAAIRHSTVTETAVFAPDGRHFGTASGEGAVRVWEAATGRPAGPVLKHGNSVATVAFSPDGDTLAAGDYGPAGLIKLWDWRTGKVRSTFQLDDIVMNVAFSPDGQYLAAVKNGDWSGKPELLIWEVASERAVLRVPHCNFAPADIVAGKPQFRPDGRAVAARDKKGALRLWEVPSGTLLGQRQMDGNGVTRFSPDGGVIAASAKLGVRLLDSDTLEPLPGGHLPHPDAIQDVAFSPDGAFLLTGHETGSAQLWDVTTRKPVGPPAVLIGPIRAVTFTPDGKTCACVAADGTVRRWPVPAPFVEPDLDRLADRVALMTGQRMDDSQGLEHVPADEWRALRAKLVGDRTTALTPPRPDADWHDEVAADAEQDGDTFGAEWHLDRLAVSRPEDWTGPAWAASWRGPVGVPRPRRPTPERPAWPPLGGCCPTGCGPPQRTRRSGGKRRRCGTWTGPSC
jgi:WD40 repeat protein